MPQLTKYVRPNESWTNSKLLLRFTRRIEILCASNDINIQRLNE